MSSGSGHLREGDVQRMYDLIQEGLRDDPGEAVPWSVLDGIAQLIGGNVAFNEQDYQREVQFTSQQVTEGERYYERRDKPESDERLFWSLFWGSYCSYPQRTGDLTSVIHEEDFGSVADRRKEPMWVENLWPAGVHHCLVVSLPASPGHTRHLLLQRGTGNGFTERQRQLLGLMRPHLYEIWLSAERRRNGVPQLTPREWEVLDLVAAGLTNAQIAHLLVVSSGTVRKHMEHILERLQVHTRGEAAAKALPHALTGLQFGRP